MAEVELLLASQNPGKLREMRHLVRGLPIHVVGPRDIGILDAPDETGHTFLENARLKALHYAKRSGRLAVADDAGLSVDAMNGAPGLYSSRFGGVGATDADRNRLLLDLLKDVPEPKRGAHFTSAVALARGETILFETLQTAYGTIVREPRGTNGFGYDPLFLYPEFGRTFAEVAPEQKDSASARGKAFAKLREFLATLGAA